MNVKEYFKMLSVMHIALIIGQLFFLIIAVFLLSTGKMEAYLPEMRNAFLLIVAFVTIGGIYGGDYLYSKQLETIKQLNDFKQQFTSMKTLIIVRLILLEGPSVLSVVFYIITGSWMFLIITLLIILFFFYQKPNKEKIISDMDLSDELKKLLQNEETIITYEVNN